MKKAHFLIYPHCPLIFLDNQGRRFVTVKGLAEREVKSDAASWTIKFKVSGNDFKAVNQDIEAKKALVRQFLSENNFNDQEIGAPNIRVVDLYAREFSGDRLPPLRYVVEAKFVLNSKNVDAVEKAAAKSAELISQGVILQENEYDANPKYYFTALTALRPEILAQATKSGRELAEQFAKDSMSRWVP